ncbi:type II secretion system protein [Candidatus Poribacteria bacterium]|nr:type II secretion system protein [Candidatus Poribacteria bacterium]
MKTRHAYTLIELLIVVAIMAIFAGGTMAVITAPMQERVWADAEMPLEAGAATFFAKAVSDVHDAGSLEYSDSPSAIFLWPVHATDAAVAYVVGPDGVLRRVAGSSEDIARAISEPSPSSGPALVSGVTDLRAEHLGEGPVWRISLRAGSEILGRQVVTEHSVNLAVGRGWVGEGR